MLEGKEGVCVLMILMTTMRMCFEDDQASLNNEDRFAPRGERRVRGF